MAGPAPKPDILHHALSREQERQRMEERSSNEALLDEEGIALKDLSHQRSPVDTSRPSFPKSKQQPQLQSSTNVVQKGWRKGTRDDLSNRERSDTLTMGRIYERMGKLSVIPRYLLYILPLGLLIAVPIIIGALMPKLGLGVVTFFI